MTVEELIEKLQRLPAGAEVMVDRGGAYDEARSVEYNPALKSVFISSDPEE